MKIKKRRYAPLVLLLCAAISAMCSGCYFFPDEEEVLDPPTIDAAEVVYSTYSAKKKDMVSKTIVSGYVRSKTEEECYFTRYTGQLKNIYVKPGDVVEEGQLLAEMNNGALEYDLEIQRLKVEQAQLTYNASGAAIDKLNLEIEQNTLAKYQDEYDGGRIYAPISGQVSYVDTAAPGASVDPYHTIVKIVDPDDLFVSATTTDTVFESGQSVTVNISGDTYDGVISLTPKEALEADGEITDQMHVDFTGDKPSFAYLGSIADVTYVTGESKDAIVIPKHLIRTDDTGRTFVQIVRDGEKLEAEITTGISNATEIEVTSGLSEGDQVVIK